MKKLFSSFGKISHDIAMTFDNPLGGQ
jgi:hypothetical protein